eukprot:TRINITY_DN197_c0_g1_i1.p1 TRINITY_DN197_c0_g1~~TRINITY_DN197_c0_g1_i1.p1  ORF type:complete len:276 (+),score=54.62 TRINITY_DN197_c0_g1_i1:120-947(+)
MFKSKSNYQTFIRPEPASAAENVSLWSTLRSPRPVVVMTLVVGAVVLLGLAISLFDRASAPTLAFESTTQLKAQTTLLAAADGNITTGANSTPATKVVVLLRHGLTMAAFDTHMPDMARPLTPQGIAQVQCMGQYLTRNYPSFVPNLALCSPAVRTRETAQLFLNAASASGVPVQFVDGIYSNNTAAGLFNILLQADNSAGVVMEVGHSPGLLNLTNLLINPALSNPAALQVLQSEGFPPGAVAIIQAQVGSWAGLKQGTNTLVQLLTPADVCNQ